MKGIELLLIKDHSQTLGANIIGYTHKSLACHVQEGNGGVGVQCAAQNDTRFECNGKG